MSSDWETIRPGDEHWPGEEHRPGEGHGPEQAGPQAPEYEPDDKDKDGDEDEK